MTHVTKTLLNRRGYRKGNDCYYKARRCAARPENKVTVQVQLFPYGWFDVTAIEKGNVEQSRSLRGLRQLKQWESFAFCT